MGYFVICLLIAKWQIERHFCKNNKQTKNKQNRLISVLRRRRRKRRRRRRRNPELRQVNGSDHLPVSMKGGNLKFALTIQLSRLPCIKAQPLTRDWECGNVNDLILKITHGYECVRPQTQTDRPEERTQCMQNVQKHVDANHNRHLSCLKENVAKVNRWKTTYTNSATARRHCINNSNKSSHKLLETCMTKT